MDERNQKRATTIAFEARGKREDAELELAFLRLTQQEKYEGRFQIKILPKISNCCGLQLADLVARPIGRHIFDPSQSNRSYDIIRNKIEEGAHGLRVFP